MYHMDADIYGHPNYGLAQTQGQQFVRGSVGDVGRGLYKWYNPTGPFKISTDWHMSGQTLTLLRQAWEDMSAFAFGSPWFTLDIPLMYDDSAAAQTSTTVIQKDSNVTVTVGSDATAIGYNASGLGASSMSYLGGLRLGQLLCLQADGTVRVQVDAASSTGWLTAQLSDAKGGLLSDLRVQVPDAGYDRILTWTGAAYEESSDTLLRDYLIANDGSDVAILVTIPMSSFQRYTCHFVGMYRATVEGYDYWKVAATLDVDPSTKLVIS